MRSHSGEPVHVAAVRRLLQRGPVSASMLRNPRDRMTKGKRPPIYDNCSGKHAGCLVACVRRGWTSSATSSPAHPLHRRVLRAVTVATGVERPRIDVDGCGLPVHGVPLRAMATMYAPGRARPVGATRARRRPDRPRDARRPRTSWAGRTASTPT